MSAQERLTELRARMRELDRKILELVAQRLETSIAIGDAKRGAGLPIRDFRVEAQVLSRARQTAQELGYDPDVAERVQELLVAAAVQTQAEHTSRRDHGHMRILVVGGSGRMGAWLARFLDAQGHQVSNCDPAGHEPGAFKSLPEARPETFDAVAVCTPLGATPQILQEVLEYGGDPLVFDIGSLKAHSAPVLREAAARGRKVTSLHPMFAPGPVLLTGRAVLICDAGSPPATQAAGAFFEGTALSLVHVPLEEHDKIMAVVLGMSHAVNLLFAASLPRFGLPFSLLGQVSSTTFSKQVKTSSEVSEENPLLYHEIQHLNQHTPEVYQSLAHTLQELQQASQDSDSGPFGALMERGRDYFKGS